jgi:Transglycosylase SLT domain
MDDRYPDFWSEANWPRRRRHDPFRVRLVVLLVASALLTPLALLIRRNDGDVVTTGGLPGAAVALEPVVGDSSASTALMAVPSPDTVAAGTLPPVVGAAAVAPTPTGTPAAVPGAGTLPPTVGTLPATLPPPTPEPTPQQATRSTGGSSDNGSTPAPAQPEPEWTPDPEPEPTPDPEPEPDPEPAPTPPRPKPTPAPAPPAVSHTNEQIESLIRRVFPDDEEEKALAVAWRESRHDPRAYNGWCCYGLFQIYFDANAKLLATVGITSAAQLFDPVLNTTAAFALFRRSGWAPWGG